MVTKREVANAQQLVMASVDAVLRRQDQVEVDGCRVIGDGLLALAISSLRVSRDDLLALQRDLEGAGPAVARSTSIAAAKHELPRKGSQRRRVLEVVVAHYNHFGVGMTSDKIMRRLKGEHQTVSARVSELVNKHELLRDSGMREKTHNGRPAIMWVPTEAAREMMAAVVAGRDDG